MIIGGNISFHSHESNTDDRTWERNIQTHDE